MKYKTRAFVGQARFTALTGAHWLTVPSGTASGAARWPSATNGGVETTQGASALNLSYLSRVARIIVPAAPAAAGRVEIRDANGGAVPRFVLRCDPADKYPKCFSIAGGIGMKWGAGGFSVAWVGDAAGVSPEFTVAYNDLTGVPI
jgi:hypothetical protein